MRTLLISFLATLFIPAFVLAQNVDVKIMITGSNGSQAQISGKILDQKTRNLSFVRSVGSFDKLGERVTAMVLKDSSGKIVNYQSPIPSEFIADAEVSEFSYLIDLSPRKEQNAAAHVSWVGERAGLLMFNDILPILGKNGDRLSGSIDIQTQLPKISAGGAIRSDNLAADMFMLGSDTKQSAVRSGEMTFTVISTGNWNFGEKDVDDAIIEIAGYYQRSFGSMPFKYPIIRILPFPGSISSGQWQAETRGRNITIVSSDMAFRTQSVQRLHEQLRHEMFHLWIPNGVNLSGNYDWFYEGFALYQSLKTGVALNRIRFDDFLDTLSRARAIDARQSNRLSLIEASNKRWSGADTYIYARGMVTAFLCDLLLLDRSKGKRSVNDVLQEFYAEHKYPGKRIDGNAAAIEILKKNFEIRPVIEKYISGSGKFDWQPELALAGLESTTGLKVMPKLNGRQKDMLDRLGYNNWQRLSPSK